MEPRDPGTHCVRAARVGAERVKQGRSGGIGAKVERGAAYPAPEGAEERAVEDRDVVCED